MQITSNLNDNRRKHRTVLTNKFDLSARGTFIIIGSSGAKSLELEFLDHRKTVSKEVQSTSNSMMETPESEAEEEQSDLAIKA